MLAASKTWAFTTPQERAQFQTRLSLCDMSLVAFPFRLLCKIKQYLKKKLNKVQMQFAGSQEWLLYLICFIFFTCKTIPSPLSNHHTPLSLEVSCSRDPVNHIHWHVNMKCFHDTLAIYIMRVSNHSGENFHGLAVSMSCFFGSFVRHCLLLARVSALKFPDYTPALTFALIRQV